MNDALVHDWRFAIHGAGLWLLDQAFDGKGKLAAHVDEVVVEG